MTSFSVELLTSDKLVDDEHILSPEVVEAFTVWCPVEITALEGNCFCANGQWLVVSTDDLPNVAVTNDGHAAMVYSNQGRLNRLIKLWESMSHNSDIQRGEPIIALNEYDDRLMVVWFDGDCVSEEHMSVASRLYGGSTEHYGWANWDLDLDDCKNDSRWPEHLPLLLSLDDCTVPAVRPYPMPFLGHSSIHTRQIA